jgi:hypothetical protein
MIGRGQMARTSIFGASQGIPSSGGRAATAAPQMPRPSKVYWQAVPTGLIQTPSNTALAVGATSTDATPADVAPAAPTTGGCCG